MRRPFLLLLATPAFALRLGEPLPTATPTQDTESSFQVVVMLMTAPANAAWRDMVRRHWPQAASNVSALGRDVDLVMRFAIGKAPDEEQQVACYEEARRRGDLALLNVSDGVRQLHSKAQHNGKIWFVFRWALTHFPKAELYFKQDDDNIVNWRVALPTMLAHSTTPNTLPLQRKYLGRIQMEAPGKPCGMGELYGFSKDIVYLAAKYWKPQNRTEDVATCAWAYGMEQLVAPVDWGGLLSWPAYENAWIHPVKDVETYESCFRESSCKVKYLWGDEQDITFRWLPDMAAAQTWLRQNSTAKQEVRN